MASYQETPSILSSDVTGGDEGPPRRQARKKAEAGEKKDRRRSAGEGSVFEYKGRWRGQVTWTGPDGQRHRRTVSADTSKAARGKLDKLREELRLGTIAPASDLTVGAYLTGWIERQRTQVRASTWTGREKIIRVHLIPRLGRVQLIKLTSDQVEAALADAITPAPVALPVAKRGRGRPAGRAVSAQMARHIRATLRRALADAVRSGIVGRNVAADARPPRVPDRAVDYLSAPAVRRLLDAAKDDPYGPLYGVAVATGMRQGELLALHWRDVNLRSVPPTITVRLALARTYEGLAFTEPKTARSRRTFHLPRLACEALAVQQTRQDAARRAAGDDWQDRDGLVFTDGLGSRLVPSRVSMAFQRTRKAAGVPYIAFHGLRHTAATLMLSAGVPLAVISDILGHSGIAITAKFYASVTPPLLVDAASAMDRAMDDGR